MPQRKTLRQGPLFGPATYNEVKKRYRGQIR